MTKRKSDSILASNPTNEITLTDRLGKSHTLKLWRRKAEAGAVDMFGSLLNGTWNACMVSSISQSIWLQCSILLLLMSWFQFTISLLPDNLHDARFLVQDCKSLKRVFLLKVKRKENHF